MSSKRPTSARPTPARRSGSADRANVHDTPTKKNDDILYECRAAFLVDHEDVTDNITSREQLRAGMIPSVVVSNGESRPSRVEILQVFNEKSIFIKKTTDI